MIVSMPVMAVFMGAVMVSVVVSVVVSATAVRLRFSLRLRRVFGDAGCRGSTMVMRGQTKRYEKLARRQVRRDAQEKYQKAQYGF